MEAIDDMEQGRTQTIEEAWKERSALLKKSIGKH